MSEIRVTSVVGENGGDRVGLTTGLTVGPLTGTTGIGATITHQGHAQFAGVCTATSFSGTIPSSNLSGALPAISGANLTGVANPTLAHAFVFMDSQYFTSTATKLAFNTSTANDQSSGVTIDRTNRRFIPTVGGVYQVVSSLDFDRGSGGSSIEYKLMQYKNGSEFARKTSFQYSTGINDGLTCLSLMSLNGSGDYVEMYAQHNASGNATMNVRSTFFIIRIG